MLDSTRFSPPNRNHRNTGDFMTLLTTLRRGLLTSAITAITLSAQNATPGAAQAPDSTKPAPSAKPAPVMFRSIDVQRLRPADLRGLNQFEPAKDDGVAYNGFALHIGGAFLQSFQGLTHENSAAPKVTNNVDANKLMTIGNGFNNSVANLFIDAQVADGIRVSMTSYLSARHHNETWVKDGYLIVDKSPVDLKLAHDLFKYVTLKFGQFEVNYGDMHYRRTDNGQAMYNPFIGNLIMDAMTTEVGGEVQFKKDGFLAMAGVTNAESKGLITNPAKRTAAYLGKLGFDRKFGDDLRLRLTGSLYTTSSASNNVLYSGDRAGSRYYYVVENTAATDAAQAWSGQVNPGFGHNVKAYVINPFVKYNGLEVFANIEHATGHSWTETADRSWDHNAFEALYRFYDAKLYLGGRMNTAEGKLAGITNELKVERTQVGGGWYMTPNILLKAELIDQKYKNFPTSDIRSGARFRGFMIEGVVGF
jgi:hypothetical protein